MINNYTFEQDNTIQRKSFYVGIIGTAIFWLVLLISMIFIKLPKKAPKYQTVKIVLSQTETKKISQKQQAVSSAASTTQNKIQESSSAKSNPNPKIQETKSKTESKTQPQSSKAQQPKPKPVQKQAEKTNSKPAAIKEPETYAKDLTEIDFSQNSSKNVSTPTWNDLFDDDEDFPEQPRINQKVTEASSMSGDAGDTTSKNVPKAKTESENRNDKASADSSTKDLLQGIKNSTFSNKTGNVEGQIEAEGRTSSDGNNYEMAMSNGKTRRLLEPKKPTIVISEANAKLIDSRRQVTISFIVEKNGHVPLGEIQITPESSLPSVIRNEIIEQVSKWRFEAADYSAIAEFEYNIFIK